MNNQKNLLFQKKNMQKNLVEFIEEQETRYRSSEQMTSLLNRLDKWGKELKKRELYYNLQ